MALVSWQAAADRTAQRGWWLCALGGSLACALLTHSYAFLIFIPITLGELSRTISRKRLDWPVWIAIATASLAVLASIPFVHRAVSEVGSQYFFSARPHKIIDFYEELLMPAVSVLVGWLVLTGLVRERTARGKTESSRREEGLREYEIVALCTFVALPVFEYVAAGLTGAPFMNRYGLSAVAGFAGLLGLGVWKKPTVAIGTLILLVGQIGVAFLGFRSGSVLREPSSGYQISTRVRDFDERYEWMMAADKTLPVVLIEDLDFMSTAYYAPSTVASRLVYGIWPAPTVMGNASIRLRACCNSEPKIVVLADFLAAHDAFLVYGGPFAAKLLEYFVDSGASIKTMRDSGDHFLVLVTYPNRTAR